MTATDIKQELLHKIEQLPASRLHAVLQFVNELSEFKETQLHSITDENEDPLLGFIGQDNYGSLAQNIDEELYAKEIFYRYSLINKKYNYNKIRS